MTATSPSESRLKALGPGVITLPSGLFGAGRLKPSCLAAAEKGQEAALGAASPKDGWETARTVNLLGRQLALPPRWGCASTGCSLPGADAQVRRSVHLMACKCEGAFRLPVASAACLSWVAQGSNWPLPCSRVPGWRAASLAVSSLIASDLARWRGRRTTLVHLGCRSAQCFEKLQVEDRSGVAAAMSQGALPFVDTATSVGQLGWLFNRRGACTRLSGGGLLAVEGWPSGCRSRAGTVLPQKSHGCKGHAVPSS